MFDGADFTSRRLEYYYFRILIKFYEKQLIAVFHGADVGSILNIFFKMYLFICVVIMPNELNELNINNTF